MSDQDQEDADLALEPSTLPNHPLRAQDVTALIVKKVG